MESGGYIGVSHHLTRPHSLPHQRSMKQQVELESVGFGSFRRHILAAPIAVHFRTRNEPGRHRPVFLRVRQGAGRRRLRRHLPDGEHPRRGTGARFLLPLSPRGAAAQPAPTKDRSTPAAKIRCNPQYPHRWASPSAWSSADLISGSAETASSGDWDCRARRLVGALCGIGIVFFMKPLLAHKLIFLEDPRCGL